MHSIHSNLPFSFLEQSLPHVLPENEATVEALMGQVIYSQVNVKVGGRFWSKYRNSDAMPTWDVLSTAKFWNDENHDPLRQSLNRDMLVGFPPRHGMRVTKP